MQTNFYCLSGQKKSKKKVLIRHVRQLNFCFVAFKSINSVKALITTSDKLYEYF